ncbi:MAG TPA: M48 family metallopeptidase [bacterium]|nr:M48 family metallopeptidase [bacterium]
MNIFTIIILGALLFSYLLDRAAGVLNVRTLGDPLPAEFEGLFDTQAYTTMQEYTRAKTRFGFITATFDLALLLLFWFAGGFNWLDQLVRGLGFTPIITGLLFIGLLTFASSLLSLPFSLYATFVLEERFGFNRTTIKTFILDLLKGVLLAVVLGGPLLAGVLAFFQYAGTWAWFYAWLATTLFSLLVTFIAPTWIMPLFNKFTPLEEGELRASIMAYAEKVRFPLKGVFVMDGSKRSSKSNAFFTGFGKNKRIALFDTLIEKHTTAELTAVLAHEIGHYKKKHIITGMVMSICHMGVMFFLLSIFIRLAGLHAAFGMQEVSLYAGLLFFGLLYSPVELILGPLMNLLSRKHEFEADQFAVTTSGLGEAMISALKKLSRDNLSHLTPHPFYVFLHYSHPPILERIAHIRRIPASSLN